MTRQADHFQAQLTGQGALEIFAESDSSFFYKAVNAQLDFVAGGAPVTSVVLHQNGVQVSMLRIDDATVAQIKADFEARIASNLPASGSEAAERKMINAVSTAIPNYEDIEPQLASAVCKGADGECGYAKSGGGQIDRVPACG